MDGELLGSAVLDVAADLSPLARDLALAKAMVSSTASDMDRMLKLKVEAVFPASTLSALQAQREAARATAAAYLELAAAEKTAATEAERAARVRANLGTISTSPAAVRAGENVVETQATRPAVGAPQDNRMWGVRGPAAPGSLANPVVVVIEAASRTPMGSLAAAIGESSSAGGTENVATVTQKGNETRIAAPVIPHQESSRGPWSAVDAAALSAAFDLGTRAQKAALAQKLAYEGRGDEALTMLAASGGSRGGGGGGHNVGFFSGGGGKHGGIGFSPFGGFFYRRGGGGGGDEGLGRRLLWGSGMFGLAGLGTLGGFAGLGAEHALFTAGGVLGSGVAALGGGGLLAAGAAGQIGVGAGSDLGVLKSTIADTQTLYKSYNAVSEAVAKYGKGSEQALEAQHELNVEMAALGNTAGVKAELGLAKSASALNEFWDKQTSGARVKATEILDQFVHLGHDYVPRVAKAAEENLGIINKGIKPLFSWLEGPEGVGVWNTLERGFRENLPTSVHAFDQAIEFTLKTIRDASGYTGGFTKKLDDFFTKWNEPQHYAVWRNEIDTLINDFHVWGTFVKLLGEDLFYLFSNDAHTGRSLIETLNGMLLKLREWEKSTEGKDKISNIFLIHKEEVLALLKALVALADPFAKIYLELAPLAVPIVTDLAEGVSGLVSALDKLSPATASLLGLALVLAKLKLLLPAVEGIGAAFGQTFNLKRASETERLTQAIEAQTAAQTRATAAASGEAVAQEAVASSQTAATASAVSEAEAESALGTALGTIPTMADLGGGAMAAESVVAGGLSRAALKDALVRGGALGFAGGAGGSLLAGTLGLHGTTNTALTLAGVGAGFGTAIAPGIGTAIGAGIGAATPYVVKFLDNVLSEHAPDYGKTFGEGFTRSFGGMLTHSVRKEIENTLDDAANELHKANQKFQEGLLPHSQGRKIVAPDKADVFDKRFNEEFHVGSKIAASLQTVERGIQQPSAGALARINIKELLQVPPGEGRDRAAQLMVEFAKGLEAEGRLAKGAMKRILEEMEKQLPGFSNYIAAHGFEADHKLSEALALKQSEAQLRNTLGNMIAQFGLALDSPAATGKTLVREWEGAMRQLATASREHVPGATKALEELGSSGSHTLSVFAHKAKSELHSVENTVSKLSHSLPEIGASGFAKYESLVTRLLDTVSGGVGLAASEVQRGVKLINKTLESELGALGVPEEIKVGLVQGRAITGKKGAELPASPFGGAAQGTLMRIGSPEAAGHDSVPLNVGGHPIMVGDGEEVAVFNRHQLPIVNAGLSMLGYDGLEGLFNQVTTPHFMASGGLIGEMISQANRISAKHYPYVWGGGHNSSFTGPFDCSGAVSSVLHAAGLLAQPEVSGELMNWGIPGPGAVTVYANPKHTFMSIMGKFFGTHGSEGAGWYTGSALPGFTVRHAPVGDSGFSIDAPHVSGKGPISEILRAGLKKDARAASHYLANHAFGSESSGISAGHGGISKTEMEALWRSAGGPPSAAHLMAAIALAESGGNPQALNPSGASGLWQILGLPFPGDPFNPLTNARMAVSKFRSQGLGAWVTYTSGAYKQFMARGGLMGFTSGGKPKGTKRITKPKAAPKLKTGSLISGTKGIPGMGGVVKLIESLEGSSNALGSEAALFGEFSSNPASILEADLTYFSPYMQAGQPPYYAGETVPFAERQLARYLLGLPGHGEGNNAFSEQTALLSWIGGLDDHRLLTAGQAALTHAPGYAPVKAGMKVFEGELWALEAQKRMTEAILRQQKTAASLAKSFIEQRVRRRLRIVALLHRTYKRFKAIKAQLEKTKFDTTMAAFAKSEAKRERTVHLDEISQAIAFENSLPHFERDTKLIHGLESQRAALKTSYDALEHASKAPVIEAELKKQMHPLEEQLHDLSGSSTSIGKSGRLGELEGQIKKLRSGAGELNSKVSETSSSTLPKLSLSIERLRSELQESGESVRPLPISSAAESSAESQKSELLKQQLQEKTLAYAVSQAQYKVLEHFPPFGGSFAKGGIVPGPEGSPKMILAHGGEGVGKMADFKIVVEDGAVDTNKIKVIANGEVVKVSRTTGRNAFRSLPSRGGGQLG